MVHEVPRLNELTLHLLEPTQYAMAAAWLGEPDTNRWLYAEWRGRAVDEKLVAVVAINARNRLYALHYGDRPVGLVAMSEINRVDECASVWYLLGDRSLAGRGLMSRGVGLLCESAWKMGLHSLHASVMDGNLGSIKVLENAGFRFAGRLRDAFKVGEKRMDRLLYDILRIGDTTGIPSTQWGNESRP